MYNQSWYDKWYFRVLMLMAIYILGALVLGIIRVVGLGGAFAYGLKEFLKAVGNLWLLSAIALPFGLLHLPTFKVTFWWLQLLTGLGFIGLPVAIFRTKSRRTLVVCYILFIAVILLLVRGCASVPNSEFSMP
jgi:hypothetical protein